MHINKIALLVGLTLAMGASAGTETDSEITRDFGAKIPSQSTIDFQQRLRKSLPFGDARDIEESRKGFIAAPKSKKIISETGSLVWDMGRYDFLLKAKNFGSINPSLEHQAVINTAFGLYEVVPGKIYQVRGFDLSNISFVRGDTGWIVFDPLSTKETAKAALDLVDKHLGKRPIVAVVYSHSHPDHFGGIRGIVNEDDVKSGRLPIIAPAGFMEHAMSEFVVSGNLIYRRGSYQYGSFLPADAFGHVDQAIGKTGPRGTMGLIAPTRLMEKPFEEMTVDGVKMEFQNTPGTEAPAEMNTYFPQLKAFWAAENITGTIHNIYTLRGAPVRDALLWSKHINEALYRYGVTAEVIFSAHNWPRWGNARIQQVMATQRDTYANLNNEVMHLANEGVTINEIHNVYKLPESLRQQWAAHSYHGSEEHNSRAVINRYIGYWDGNPATLIPLSPRDSAPLYVEMMGGPEKVIRKSTELNQQGKYRESVEILNKLVYAEPDNAAAKELLADAFEQIGYQQESTSLRNSFLAGAFELRHGMPKSMHVVGERSDLVKAMETEQWLDYLGIALDESKVANLAFTFNLIIPDQDEKFVVQLSNSTLTNLKGYQAPNPDLTITVNRADLELVMAGKQTLRELAAAGKATLVGDTTRLAQLMGAMTRFQPDFELVPGTKVSSQAPL